MKIVIIALLVLVVASLASGLVFLMKDRGQTDRTVKALTLRVGLSITVFIIVIVMFATGMLPAR